jgi:hypothetical protein
LKAFFDKESYDKLEFLRFRVASPAGLERGSQLTVKANLHWFMEGHDGVTTYYFFLVHEGGAWLVDGILR